jgi:hypothetical protein
MLEYFYHERIRKSVAIFGTMFNDIMVLRKRSDGRVISQIKVPLSYAPKEKYLARIRSNPDLDTDTKVALKLPRMSFEITSLQYNTERKLPKMNQFSNTATSTTKNKFFTPAPYDISFQLNIYAKTQDDALQIVEQIIPYFNPHYTITMKPFAKLASGIKEDVPITLTSVNFSDDFEGSLEQRRTIIYTLDFTMLANFYGPINSGKIVRKTITDVHNQILGDSNDPQLAQYTIDPNPLGISPPTGDSDFGFTQTIIENFDSA